MSRKIIYDENTTNLILKLYLEGVSISKITEKLNLTITPVKKLIKNNGLLRKGYSNGRKIILTEEQKLLIKKMYLEEYKTSKEISKIFNVSFQYVEKIITKDGYRRNKSEGVSVGLVKRYKNMNYKEYLTSLNDYYKYELEVFKFTKQQPIHLLNNYEKRGNSGIDGSYHLDHKYSIVEGFKNGIEPHIIGSIKNLEFIPWQENIKKRTKCSITLEELKLS
jgi:transposase